MAQNRLWSYLKMMSVGCFCAGFVSVASATGGSLTYHGRLLNPNGKPVVSTNVQFLLQVRSPSPTNCLMYQEIHTKDLSLSQGVFSLSLNDGSATSLNTEPFNLDRVFQNYGEFHFPVGKCSVSLVYQPDAFDSRSLHVAFNDGTFSGWEPLPAQQVNYVPSALNAVNVGGFQAGHLFRVTDSAAAPVNLDPWTEAQYQKLLNIRDSLNYVAGVTSITGTSAGFTGLLSGDVSGGQSLTRVERLQGRDVSNTLPADGQILKWNNASSQWEPGNVPVAGNPDWADITNRPASLPPSGSASGDLTGTYPNPTIANNAVTAGKIAAGAVAFSKIAAGSANGQVLRYESGTGWAPMRLNYVDLVNNVGGSPWPGSCVAGSFMNWNSGTDAFECVALTNAMVAGALTTLPVSKGGTGATTEQAARNNLLPTQTGNAGKILQTDGTNVSWENAPSTGLNPANNLSELTNTTTARNNLGLGTAATKDFGTAAGNLVELDGSGRVPASLLPNQSGTYFTQGGNAFGAPAVLGTTDAQPLHLQTGGTNKVTILDNGNVGVGTTNPSQKLHVSGKALFTSGFSSDSGALVYNNDTDYLYLGPTSGSSANGAAISLRGATNTSGGVAAGSLSLGAKDFPYALLVQGTSGNVGIGTTVPALKLHVHAPSGDVGQFITTNSNSTATPALWLANDYAGTPNYAGISVQGSTLRLKASTTASFSGVEGISVQQSGNVGIGTTNPGQKLSVAGSATLGYIAGSSAGLYLTQASDYGIPSIQGVTSAFGNQNIAINPVGGNVGIGTTTPSEMLEVAGNIKATQVCIGTDCRSAWPGTGGGGTVTSVATGTGLTGGPITGSGTISIASGGVGTTQLAGAAVTTAKIGDGQVTGLKLETISGLTNGTYGSSTEIPSITVDTKGRITAISTNTVSALPAAAGVSGKFLKSNGSAWSGQDILFSDIKNSLGSSAFNLAGCGPSKTVQWSSLTDSFSCQDIDDLDAGKITTGTLNASRLPTSITNALWTESSGNVYRASGNVGIGTTSPSSRLTVAGGDAEIYGVMMGRGAGAFPSNTVIGSGSLSLNASGQANSAVGNSSLWSNTTGGRNSAFGNSALLMNSTGSDNTAIGVAAGSTVTTGSNNIAIGYNAQVPSATADNQISIGNMIYAISGKVGIGTTSPTSKLDVRGAAVIANSDYVLSSAGSGLQFYMGSTSGNTYSQIQAFQAGYTSSANLILQPWQGNVGIGTTSPGALLELDNTADTNTAGSGHKLRLSSSGTGLFGFRMDSGNDHLVLDKHWGGSWGSAMSINRNTGNVGIGTSTPASQLHISSTVDGEVGARVQNASAGTGAYSILRLSNNTVSNLSLFLNSSGRSVDGGANTATLRNDAGALRLLGSGSSGIYIAAPSGNVGIGTTTPSYTLHVVGSAGLSTGTAWTNASDARLKDIHGDYQRGLDEILQLHTVLYNYKKDNALGLPSDFVKTGFIAQEVQKVIPEAVNQREDGYLELNVDPIHWAVVNAIKGLYKKLVGYRDEVESVKSQVRELQSENQELKRVLLQQSQDLEELKRQIKK